MGCFLACFGSSKDRRRRKHHRQNKVQPRVQRKEAYSPVQSTVSVVQEYCPEKPIVFPVSEIRDDGLEEKLSLSARKKVTFNSNVTTYDHIPVEESTDFTLGEEDGDKREEKEESFAKPSQSQSSSEDSSIASSLRSYPPNHRYQNCRDSDDELGYEESDIDDSDEDGEDDDGG
ncbi:unnamed protein product [Dovyalis caffra]|uniref:Uncharacterized protein n=1 Tax=Dovyalis caffra TaxID=77055 RepID=A0AAV1SGI6_9ROSI|nr:unnamed protein product [Dovyalis caffra]